ncbi:MAG TPA: caspase family protein [Pyrinomonadaceae bacterium]|jgi:hypothetical protein|nr:caspase family protein [Pyrinomonadaceae bacterium]
MKRSKKIIAAVIVSLLSLALFQYLPHSLAKNLTPRPGKRRALLIGISKYESARFPKLEYPPNDVARLAELLESPEYGFSVTKLTDDSSQKPTRENIIKAIQKVLIDGAEPGDVSLFYFSGHGSSVKNSLSDEADHRDETIVPMDAVRPVTNLAEFKDIRDKEIAEIFDRAVEKGVKLTAIFDSCHSGSIARGDEQAKEVEEADFDIKLAPTEAQRIKPEDRGALIITAAEDYQQASGGTYQLNGREAKYSHLTAELLQTLYETPADRVSASDLFRRITARLTAAGRTQTPTIAGDTERLDEDIFGEAARPAAKIRIPVTVNSDGRLVLAGGVADGLADGAELQRIDPATGKAGSPPVKIIVKRTGLSLSEFEVFRSSGNASIPTAEDRIAAGNIFEQSNWILKKEPNLTVWIPPAQFREADLVKAAAAFSTLQGNKGIDLLAEPEGGQNRIYPTQTATKIEWNLRRENGFVTPLGTSPSAEKIASVLMQNKLAKPRLFVDLPPSPELRKELDLAFKNDSSGIAVAANRDAATYILTGRYKAETGKIEYAWTLRSQLDSDVRAGRNSPARSLPPLTDWVSADTANTTAGELKTLVLKLGKISGWLKLQSPIGVGSAEFPYRLEIHERTGTARKALAFGEPLYKDKDYEFVLVADPSKLKNNNMMLPEFSVYVMEIDSTGKGHNMGFTERYGGMENFSAENPPQAIVLTGDVGDTVKMGEPYGTEIFVLLVTDRPLLNAGLLEFNGVRGQSLTGRGAFNPLDDLLQQVGVKTTARGNSTSPDTWAVQQLIMTSADAK